MNKSQNTVWIAGAGVLAALIVIATYFLAVAPQRSEAADLATQRVSVAETNAGIAQRTEELKSEFQTLDEKKNELAAIQATLPKAAEVPDLLRQLASFGETSGVNIEQITPGTPEQFNATADATTDANSGIVAIPLVLGVKGTFPEVELYVKTLQADLTRDLFIEDLTVATAAEAGATDGVTATISGRIFVLPDAADAGTSTGSTETTGTAETGTPTTTSGTASTGTVS
ncbi:type 4a pilus biogenesis protein PilO [Kineococcus sp. GCM10028916]|uniref:type 4a pilus biogenesis protein PilO n=1 Tax=Kineococcus sp. GCM10028916 TaxID=3273394 RepID=UPI00363BAD89